MAHTETVTALHSEDRTSTLYVGDAGEIADTLRTLGETLRAAHTLALRVETAIFSRVAGDEREAVALAGQLWRVVSALESAPAVFPSVERVER